MSAPTDAERVVDIEDAAVLALVSGWTGDRLSLYFELRTRFKQQPKGGPMCTPSERRASMQAWVTWVTLCRQLVLLGDAECEALFDAALLCEYDDIENGVHSWYPEHFALISPGQIRAYHMERVAIASPAYRPELVRAYETGNASAIFIDEARAAFWRLHC